MAFRKGHSDPTAATIYFMVFATTNLSRLNDAKTTMQRYNQTSGDCAFSDYFHLKGVFHPKGRKTTFEDESRAIFEALKDQPHPMALGLVKRFVIEETPVSVPRESPQNPGGRKTTNCSAGGPKRKPDRSEPE